MHPILFHLPTPWGDVPIFSYGVMLGLSLVVGWNVVMWLGTTREKLSRDFIATTFVITFISALVGSRILYVVTNPEELTSPLSFFAFREGGLVAYGGFLGGFFGAWAYLRPKRVPLMAWADLAVPALGSGLFFTRIGCYLYGCDFGARLGPAAPGFLRALGTFPRWPDELSPGAVACSREVSGSPAFVHHVEQYGLTQDAAASFPVHPTQLYESLVGLALFVLALAVHRRRQFRGQVLTVVVMAYGTWRFFIECVRDDPERGGAFGLTTSQLLSLVLVPLAGWAYVALRRRAARGDEPRIPKRVLEGKRGQQTR